MTISPVRFGKLDIDARLPEATREGLQTAAEQLAAPLHYLNAYDVDSYIGRGKEDGQMRLVTRPSEFASDYAVSVDTNPVEVLGYVILDGMRAVERMAERRREETVRRIHAQSRPTGSGW